MLIAEILKAIFLGIIEGITEWLPVSSTGHMLLVDEFLSLDMSDEFKEMFFYVIQLAAIIAVIILFWDKMFPFQFSDRSKPVIKKDTFMVWVKVVIACIPGAIVTLLFDDIIDAHLHKAAVIAAALIIYGIAFIVIEKRNKDKKPSTEKLEDITFKQALEIGLFQTLSIIPGTSRSGSTIMGGLVMGISRVAVSEFTFFLAVPVMVGMSAIKLIKFGFSFTPEEIFVLAAGSATAFMVSVVVIKVFMGYIRKHDFTAFGWYRIILGAAVLALELL